jgi:hypothetical protein
MASLARGLGEKARSASRFFIHTIDWTSSGDPRRPKFSERSDIQDPSAGWSHPDPAVREALDAEREGPGRTDAQPSRWPALRP